MDERFAMADTYGNGCDPLVVHNISASLMKDLKIWVSAQTQIPYDLVSDAVCGVYE